MSTDIKTELRIPDIWLDFYGRLIPGTVFLFALRVFILDKANLPNAIELLLTVFGGYFIGLLSNPISSFLKKHLFRYAEKKTGKGSQFVAKVQAKLGQESRRALILSKMHAECLFYVQLFVLSCIWKIVYIFYKGLDAKITVIFIVIILYLSFCAWEATNGRLRKAEMYNAESDTSEN